MNRIDAEYISQKLINMGMTKTQIDQHFCEFTKELIDYQYSDELDNLLFAFESVKITLTDLCFIEIILISKIPVIEDGHLKSVKSDNLSVYTGYLNTDEIFDYIFNANGLSDLISDNKFNAFAGWAVLLGWAEDIEKVQPITVRDYTLKLEEKQTQNFLKAGFECIEESSLDEDSKKDLINAIQLLTDYVCSDTLYSIFDDIELVISDDEDECSCTEEECSCPQPYDCEIDDEDIDKTDLFISMHRPE
jgi:hypothetical protein